MADKGIKKEKGDNEVDLDIDYKWRSKRANDTYEEEEDVQDPYHG